MKCTYCGTDGAQSFPGEKSEMPNSFYCGYCKQEFANPILNIKNEDELLEYAPHKFVLYVMSGIELKEFLSVFVNKGQPLSISHGIRLNLGRIRSRFFTQVI